jgi:hypothetical protein
MIELEVAETTFQRGGDAAGSDCATVISSHDRHLPHF